MYIYHVENTLAINLRLYSSYKYTKITNNLMEIICYTDWDKNKVVSDDELWLYDLCV